MIDEILYEPYGKHHIHKSSSRHKPSLLTDFITADTETSWNHNDEMPVAWIYQWAVRWRGDTIVGRTPSQFISLLKKLEEYYDLGEDKKIVVYFHNLSYDWQYLKWYLEAEYGTPKILATAPHRVIQIEYPCFIFRCSYILSNRSLEKWCEDLNTAHKKLVGAVDYSKVRYQNSTLDATDWKYMELDVLTQEDCINKQMAMYGDNLQTIPLTSTGYIRRECRNNFKRAKFNRVQFLNTALTAEEYLYCKSAFAGGYTHGNRFLAGETLNKDSELFKGEIIRHRDFRSHYPSQQRCYDFPKGKFNLYKEDASLEDVVKARKDNYCCLMLIEISGARIYPEVTFPILSVAKCKAGRQSHIEYIADNGRILELNGITQLAVTDLDLVWLTKQYMLADLRIIKMYVAKKGKLPKFMECTIDEFFLGKSKFKKQEKEEKDPVKKADLALSLLKSKNGLNGIYGMTATDIYRAVIEMAEDGEWTETKDNSEDAVSSALDKYYNSYNSFMRYQWGVWTTSLARSELLHFIADIIGYENCIYCDTDSIFYFSTPEIEKRIEAENKKLYDRSISMQAYVELDGEKIVYNQFCDEEEEITDFRFLHSKCYAYIEKDSLHCTIAGVNASKLVFNDEHESVKVTREEELGSIDRLEDGTIFTICGGTKIKYGEHRPEIWEGQEVSSFAIITETTKELGALADGGSFISLTPS